MPQDLKTDLSFKDGKIGIVSGRENLAQAIEHRVLTRRGELTDLGHPEYGSRLYQLIGEPANQRTRALAELYIRECLAEEDRIKEVVDISFAPPSLEADKRNQPDVTIVVLPADESGPLTLSMSMKLEG